VIAAFAHGPARLRAASQVKDVLIKSADYIPGIEVRKGLTRR
jgi:hypothetical protein